MGEIDTYGWINNLDDFINLMLKDNMFWFDVVYNLYTLRLSSGLQAYSFHFNTTIRQLMLLFDDKDLIITSDLPIRKIGSWKVDT